ncbi:MAG: biotin transporter BioY [Owenweeksia sp.]|nr:biotin transporter BioY [Owenweeksia sp.]
MKVSKWVGILTGMAACSLLAPLEIENAVVGITIQSLILFIVAAYLGPRWGTVVLFTYLALGAIGLPVFADYHAGYEKLAGPTAGFLWGFPLAGFFLAWRCTSGEQSNIHYIVYFFQAHILLLIMGFAVLYFKIDNLRVWPTLVPLLPGLLIKSLVGGVVSYALRQNLPFQETLVESS